MITHLAYEIGGEKKYFTLGPTVKSIERSENEKSADVFFTVTFHDGGCITICPRGSYQYTVENKERATS